MPNISPEIIKKQIFFVSFSAVLDYLTLEGALGCIFCLNV